MADSFKKHVKAHWKRLQEEIAKPLEAEPGFDVPFRKVSNLRPLQSNADGLKMAA